MPLLLQKGSDSLIQEAIAALQIPENCILVLHVRLKKIHELTGLSYDKCAELLINEFQRYKPKTILVPTFTYSFTKSGLFHRLFSKSETGRFSEEVRQYFPRHRTRDPLFSVADTSGYLQEKTDSIDFTTAFGRGCLWEYLHEQDAVIVNVGIESMVSTQVHYIEKVYQVPYRKDIHVSGVVYTDNVSFQTVDYTFFARDLKENRLLNWPKIESCLIETKVLLQREILGLKISWVSCGAMMSSLSGCIAGDPYFLVSGRE